MVARKPDYLPLFDDLLRDYQKVCIGNARRDFRAGHKAVLVAMPPGCGKTTTAVAMTREGARVMVVVQQSVLVQQWVGTIKALRRRAASIEQAWEKADAGDEWIVATIQTLASDGRYRRFVGNVDLVVVDECDTHFSPAFRSMMGEFIAGGARVLGITATPYRGDRASLFGFYETCAYSLELLEAYRQAWLVQPTVTMHRVKSIAYDQLSKTRVDFKPEEICRLMESEAVLHDVANLVTQYHRKSHGVIRCRSVRQSQQLRDVLVQRYGLKCSCVWGTQPEEERKREIAMFESGENTLITNCRVLGRGWDCPQVNEMFNAAPTKSKPVFVQALGRGNRALPGVLDGKHTVEERRAAIAASAKPTWAWHDITNTSRFHCPVTAIDILLAGNREIIEKIKEDEGKDGEEQTLEELDAEMQAEIKAAEEQERVARELEKERRRGLIVGVTFDSHSRDLFATPDAKTPKVRGYRVPFGKYRGRPLRDPVVPVGWLKWALANANLNAMWTAAFTQEIARREAVTKEHSDPITPW